MKSLLTGTMFDHIDPMRHLETVVRIVERLNDNGEDETNPASFEGTRHYLAITFCDLLLWDSEGQHRYMEDYSDHFEEDADDPPTLSFCLEMLKLQIADLDRFRMNAIKTRVLEDKCRSP
jgi:hypothetical protein